MSEMVNLGDASESLDESLSDSSSNDSHSKEFQSAICIQEQLKPTLVTAQRLGSEQEVTSNAGVNTLKKRKIEPEDVFEKLMVMTREYTSFFRAEAEAKRVEKEAEAEAREAAKAEAEAKRVEKEAEAEARRVAGEAAKAEAEACSVSNVIALLTDLQKSTELSDEIVGRAVVKLSEEVKYRKALVGLKKMEDKIFLVKCFASV